MDWTSLFPVSPLPQPSPVMMELFAPQAPPSKPIRYLVTSSLSGWLCPKKVQPGIVTFGVQRDPTLPVLLSALANKLREEPDLGQTAPTLTKAPLNKEYTVGTFPLDTAEAYTGAEYTPEGIKVGSLLVYGVPGLTGMLLWKPAKRRGVWLGGGHVGAMLDLTEVLHVNRLG